MTAAFFGLVGATLQVGGYLVYGKRALSSEIKPNAASWFMFAYGNTLLCLLEWDRGASFSLLALPLACALSSIVVAVHAFRRVRSIWPDHVLERVSVLLDIALTVAYFGAGLLLNHGQISQDTRFLLNRLILVVFNIGIFTAYYPLLRQVDYEPEAERSSPWLIWSFAYAALLVATLIERRGLDELALYPLLEMMLNALIGIRLLEFQYRRIG